MNLDRYSVTLFDCDGVILDSNALKSACLVEVVAEYGEKLSEQFLHYHQTHGGVSRYEKFRVFLEDMVGNYSPERYDELLNRLADLVERKLLSVPMVAGALEFVQLSRQRGETYIVSGGDEAELNRVFRQRDIAIWFDAIYGSPVPKTQHCEHIRETMDPGARGILFGDSRLDHEAALAGDFDFVFISGHSEFEDWAAYCEKHEIPAFNDFNHLMASLS